MSSREIAERIQFMPGTELDRLKEAVKVGYQLGLQDGRDLGRNK